VRRGVAQDPSSETRPTKGGKGSSTLINHNLKPPEVVRKGETYKKLERD